MSEQTNAIERDVLIEGHDYDGIQEYDNPMPGWWLAIFYITIAWSVYYVIAISVGWINTYEKDLHEEILEIAELKYQAALNAPEVTLEYLNGLVGDPEVLATGQAAFISTCAACHGENGGGTIGPNLTDSYWVHGGGLMDIYEVADKGIVEKGMPPWGGVLSHDQLVGVVTYIDSIRDTNVAGGKEPEGTEYVPE